LVTSTELIVLATGHGEGDHRDLAVLRRRDVDRLAQSGELEALGLEALDGRLGRRLVGLGDDDRELELEALRPLLVEELDAGDAIDRIGEAGDIGDAGPQVEDRDGEGEQQRGRGDRHDDRAGHDAVDQRGPEAAAFGSRGPPIEPTERRAPPRPDRPERECGRQARQPT
jgi:hypothetical protein